MSVIVKSVKFRIQYVAMVTISIIALFGTLLEHHFSNGIKRVNAVIGHQKDDVTYRTYHNIFSSTVHTYLCTYR